MKIYKLLFTTTFFFALLGCGTEGDTQTSMPTVIGESASLVTDDPNAKMAPSRHAKEAMATQITQILKLHINELNEKEAISFDAEFNYCDISGIKNTQQYGNLKQMSINTHYEVCKNGSSLQNGDVNIIYKRLDNNGKFPKSLSFLTSNTYQFNHIKLNKNTLILANNIEYKKDGSIQSIEFQINGVIYNYTQKITLNNYQHEALF
jgi:hypothetical protein